MISNKEEYLVTDAHLSVIVDMLNRSEHVDKNGGIGVTLSFSGTIVSGLAIGRKRFFELQEESILIAVSSDNEKERAAVSRIFNPFSPPETPLTPEEEAEQLEKEKLPPQFIHLRDATIYAGHDRLCGVLWRGKLSDVSGFCFSRFGHPDSED